MPGVGVPLAFESAGADHAAILCANTGCLRERRRAACDRRPARATEKQTPRPDERERGVAGAVRVSEYAGAGPAYWPK
jgi:hypothetical protein